MHTNESAENYLETILILSQKLPVVRSVDIATELDFKKSSVSVAMKKLRENDHISGRVYHLHPLWQRDRGPHLRAAHASFLLAGTAGRCPKDRGGRCVQDRARHQFREF